MLEMLKMFKEFEKAEENNDELENDFLLYDSKEDILKCLNCTKEECNNCLRHKNFI